MTDLPRISASKIKVYETCRQNYIAKYVLKLPQQLTTYGVVGQAIHRAIDLAYTDNIFPFDTARDYIKQEYATTYAGEYIGWNESTALEKTYSMLDNVPFEDYRPKELELEFLVPFPTNNPICNLHGYIDLITEDNQIIDWKSQSRIPTKKECLTQLAVYYYGFKYTYGKEPTEMFMYHLATQRKVSLDRELLISKLAELENTIKDMLALNNEIEVKRCANCSLFCPLYSVYDTSYGE